jgi:response regulator RpfG family c-di-GMP phosphodiesterase/tRNA A-37 threonylcarbamoyl transferase component Bud32
MFGTPQIVRGGSTLDLHPNNSVCELLDQLLDSKLIQPEDWQELSTEQQVHINTSTSRDELLGRLAQSKLLTEYQVCRVRAGTTFGLVLGNYRVLDRLGAGGMGVVFRAEHILMRRIVAIKVLPLSRDQDARLLLRFLAEMRTIASLQHPNIVTAMDAGQVTPTEPNLPVLHYLVMEYVAGHDLEDLVISQGPLDVARACDLIHQVASALDAANARNILHRDMKPSNILVTPENQAKLLDFGLARDFRMQLTEPGSLLGTLEYMAPEQAIDATHCDIRADIYGLGGTLFWALTGTQPFPPKGTVTQELHRRRTEPAPSLRHRNPNLPADLDDVMSHMLAPDPENRYPNPKIVMRALEPFLTTRSSTLCSVSGMGLHLPIPPGASGPEHRSGMSRILVIDDDPSIRKYCNAILGGEGVQCHEAEDGKQALDLLSENPYDLALLDLDIPHLPGSEVLRILRSVSIDKNMRVIIISGGPSPDEMAQLMINGADDYLTKPFSVAQLRARVKASLRLKSALDQSESLNGHMQKLIRDLERSLYDRDSDLLSVRNGLVLGLASIAGHRTTETEGHLQRLQHYCRKLSEKAALLPDFAKQIDESFIRNLEVCGPLHDIGVVALPDHILVKPGKLTAEERVIMESHTLIGAEILGKVVERYGSSMLFLQTAVELARHHHERFDGKGYPDQLVGDAIPLSARILAIGDVYDALRSRRPYRPALSHSSAVQVILQTSTGQFDPRLLELFRANSMDFDQIFKKYAD